MEDFFPFSNAKVSETDVEEYCSFHAKWLSGCRAKVKYLSAFYAVVHYEKRCVGLTRFIPARILRSHMAVRTDALLTP